MEKPTPEETSSLAFRDSIQNPVRFPVENDCGMDEIKPYLNEAAKNEEAYNKDLKETESKENKNKEDKDCKNTESTYQNEAENGDKNDPKNENQEDAKNKGREKKEENGNEWDETQKAAEEPPTEEVYDLTELSKEINQFLSTIHHEKDYSSIQVIPSLIERYVNLFEGEIAGYEPAEGPGKCRQMPKEQSSFLEDVVRISKLQMSFDIFKLDPNYASILNRIVTVLQQAMLILEEEFRWLLDSRISDFDSVESKTKQDSGDQPLPESENEVKFPGYTNVVVTKLSMIAKTMIAGGYVSECCQIYKIMRRNAFDESMKSMGFERISIDEVQRMHWESLERVIATWITTFKQCATIYFPGEHTLTESVFSDYSSISASLFGNLIRCVVIQLLNFADAVAMSKRSTEKLFKVLDMFEALRDMVPMIERLYPDECAAELKAETSTVRSRLGEAIISIFSELENSIKSDSGKQPVPGGAVHPLTCYMMNYLQLTCDYKNTLEQVFKDHSKIERADSTSGPSNYQIPNDINEQQANESPLSSQLLRIMDLIDMNLEAKAKLYKDTSLSNIFLMNNGRYILQKTKASPQINELMGDAWCRKRSSELRQYHKNYQRETWGKLLSCLSPEGLNVNGKAGKPALKERFKSFNAMFEEIHKTQCTWVVSDEQLQSELRIFISGVVVPAYRSFLGRFSQHFDPGRQTEKYVKFQPEDIENYIEELFSGNAPSMLRYIKVGRN